MSEAEKIESQIFFLQMADTLTSEDYRLLNELENKLKGIR